MKACVAPPTVRPRGVELVKRLFDMALALGVLVMLALPGLLVALLVGPRPALFNQSDLIALRTKQGVHALVPGLTGWAQINGRDELSTPAKVRLDAYYLQHRSFGFDLAILARTVMRVLRSDGVAH